MRRSFRQIRPKKNPENTQAGETADFTLDNPITEEELKKVIVSLKNNKNSGIDGLIPELFKYSQGILSQILLKLFNYVFSNGVYPSSWSEGLITPIHKKGDLDNSNNYCI